MGEMNGKKRNRKDAQKPGSDRYIMSFYGTETFSGGQWQTMKNHCASMSDKEFFSWKAVDSER